ncbi:MAG TPA: DUF2271 domain-containing protein [Caulobacteraceae bacterium]|nr:DUF2271 domain-containing protein [Caulobacteraceae bacterium]
MNSKLPWLMAGAAAVLPFAVQPAQAAVHRFHEDHVLGTSLDLVVVGADTETSARALAAAKAEIARLDAVLSGWRADSELTRLNALTGPVSVSADLYQVIAQCEAFRAASGGAFSARLGEVEAQWRQAEGQGVAPPAALLMKAADRAARADVRLDPVNLTVDRDNAVLTVDALAKGYVIDAALAAAARAAPDAAGLMLDIGGDLRCHGQGPGLEPWRIGVASAGVADNLAPAEVIRLTQGAVATSGPGARDLKIGQERVNHTLSPTDGSPAPRRTVTVMTAHAAEADALATALSVMPTAQGLVFATDRGAKARIVESDGSIAATPDWADISAPPKAAPRQTGNAIPRLIRTAASTAAAWPAGFEVAIDYEIPEVAAGRYRPPFVAIWITDEDGKLVRTLFHLGSHPRRFLDSNYVWWKAFNADGDGGDKLATVTRPSRGPGKYSASWDGKDDAGKPVGQGHYVVNIEISREHGGHSLQTIPLNLGKAPVAGSARGQDESGPASARYGQPSI